MAYLDGLTRVGVGGPSRQYLPFAIAVSAAITGTATAALTETQVVDGGETVIITLTGDTWVATGATFNAERQAIIDGLDSAQAEAAGWNVEVRDKEVVGAVVRTSDTVVTITLTAATAYAIDNDETITVTVPASALVTSSAAVTAAPTFTVTAEAEPAVVSRGGGDPSPFDFKDLFKRQVIEEDAELIAIIRTFLDKVG